MPSVPGPYVCSPTGVFPVTSQLKARVGFLPPLRAINTTPFIHLSPFPRHLAEAGAVDQRQLSLPVLRAPHSGRRGPLASRDRTPFLPPLLAQEGVLSHVGGVDGKEAHGGRRGAVPSNPLNQRAPSTCSVSSRDSLRGYGWRGQASRSSAARGKHWVQNLVTPLRRIGTQSLGRRTLQEGSSLLVKHPPSVPSF